MRLVQAVTAFLQPVVSWAPSSELPSSQCCSNPVVTWFMGQLCSLCLPGAQMQPRHGVCVRCVWCLDCNRGRNTTGNSYRAHAIARQHDADCSNIARNSVTRRGFDHFQPDSERRPFDCKEPREPLCAAHSSYAEACNLEQLDASTEKCV